MLAHSCGLSSSLCGPLCIAASLSSWHGNWLPPKQERCRREQGGSCHAINNLISQVTYRRFQYILLIRSDSLGPGHFQGERNWGPSLEERSIRELVDVFKNHIACYSSHSSRRDRWFSPSYQVNVGPVPHPQWAQSQERSIAFWPTEVASRWCGWWKANSHFWQHVGSLALKMKSF